MQEKPNSSMTLVIRCTVDEDIRAITEIFAREVHEGTASWAYEAPAEDELLEKMQRLNADNYPFLTATHNEEIVGFAYVSAYRPREGYRFLVENSIYVAPSHRSRGIARALMTELIERCTARGYRQMIAVIGDSENASSIALHKSLGFTQVGLLTNIGYKFDRWLDSVLMQRKLGDGDAPNPDEIITIS